MRCSICCSGSGPFRTERRPTGPNGIMQSWPICGPCAAELERQRRDCDPVVCDRYRTFLMLLAGNYRLGRGTLNHHGSRTMRQVFVDFLQAKGVNQGGEVSLTTPQWSGDRRCATTDPGP